jgi:autotransporter-associated beta strand protein
MNKQVVPLSCLASLALFSFHVDTAVGQTLDIDGVNIVTYTVEGDETYSDFQVRTGGELIVPAGTTLTAEDRSRTLGGTIRLQGGVLTVDARYDHGNSSGAALFAESGEFWVLDVANRGVRSDGFKLPDGRPSGSNTAGVSIGDAQVYAMPGIEMRVDRNAFITFVAGGTGNLVLDEIFDDARWDPNEWLNAPDPRFGLFAPAGEEIIISQIAPLIPDGDPSGFDWNITSVGIIRSSGNLFTWGDRVADGSWGNTGGWKKNGVDTTDIPVFDGSDINNRFADPVQVLSGTVRVNSADQEAWSLDVDSGATAVVSDGFNLQILDSVNVDPNGTIEIASGGWLSGDAGLAVAAGGRLELNDGTASFAENADVAGTVAFVGDAPLSVLSVSTATIANVELSGSGSISNAGEVTVGQLSMQSDSLFQKEAGGTLILDQSGGASSLAAGSKLKISSGTVVALNSSASSSLDDATTQLEGGELVLSSTGSAAAFDSPIVVSGNSTILAGQQGAGALTNETVTLGGTHGISADSGIVTLKTANGYALNLAGDVSGAGRLDFGDAASVQVNGNVTAAGVGYVGDLSGVSIAGGSVSPTQAYYFNPSGATPEMTVPFDIDGARDVVIGDLNNANGSVGFTGPLDHTGVTRIDRGALRVGGSNNAPTASNIVFNSISSSAVAVVGSTESVLALTIGTGAGNVSWNGSGGFASSQGGSGTVVTLNGGAALDWDSPTNGFNGQSLQLGSATANALVELTNDLNLGSGASRNIQVANNSNSATDIARISGNIASSGTATDILHINQSDDGILRGTLLELTGTNTFANTLSLGGSSVFAVEGTGLPVNANLQFSSGDGERETVLLTNGTFTRSVGTGAGQVYWDDAGGFAARSGDLTVTLNGGAPIVWGDGSGFNDTEVQFGSRYADGVLTLTNDLDYGGDERIMRVFGNPDSSNDRVVLNGNIINADDVRFEGPGEVVVHGSIENSGTLRSQGGGIVIVNGSSVNTNMNSVDVRDSSSLYLNGTVNVDNSVAFNSNEGGVIGGSGQINLYGGVDNNLRVETNSQLSPGADPNSVGTLSVNLGADATETAASSFFMQPTSNYNLQIGKDGSSVINDSVSLTNENTAELFDGYIALENQGAATWTLDVSAVADLTGMVSSGDEFDVITYGVGIGLLDYDTEVFDFDTAPLISGTGEIASVEIISSAGHFNVGSATLNYDTSAGRIYLTGLVLAGGVPVPITIDVASGTQTQAQAGYPTIAAATSVTKTGAGTLVFDAANAYTGPTTVSAGTLEVANADALAATAVTVDTGGTLAVASGTTMRSPSVIVDGGSLSAGSLAVNATTGITSLAINAGTLAGSPAVEIGSGGELALVQDARVSVAVGSLTVAETTGGGRVDLGAGEIAIAAGGISETDLRADIIAGRNGGAWDGSSGIMSAAAAASGGTREVGYVVSGDGSATVSFAAPGDTDLSGQVNVFDLIGIDATGKFGSGAASVWSEGDFNYDGVTNVFDLIGIDSSGAYGAGDYFPASPTAAGTITAVPEPGTLLGLVAGGFALAAAARRTRSRPIQI